MKTITANDTNISRYIFDDDSNVILLDTCMEVYNEKWKYDDGTFESSFFHKYSLNSSNATLHSDVDPPDDWAEDKYTFDGTTWALNKE